MTNYTEEEREISPAVGLKDYFVQKFTNLQFDYGLTTLGICRYPLDSKGNRIVETLEYCPHTFGLDGGSADKSETIVQITHYKCDTPNSVYFILNPEIIDVYSNHFDLDCENISSFVNRIKQHMELINKVSPADDFKSVNCAQFNVFFNFKYDHTVKKIFRIANIAFYPISGHDKRVVFTATHNTLQTMSSLRKMDIEFFNRYYKHKIQEAMPDLGFDKVYDLINLDNWSESLKSLVKMSYY